MKKIIMTVLGFGLMMSSAHAAVVACSTQFGNNVNTTAQLTGSDGCSVDGLTFSNFSVTSAPTGASVFLSSLGTGVVGSEVDLGFQLVLTTTPQDIVLQYKVTGTTLGVDLAQNGTLTTIQEVVCDQAFTGSTCATGHVLMNYSNPPIANDVQELYINGPEHVASASSVWILKDISVAAGGSISNFTNSHVVPEPMTLSLMGVGLLGLGLMRRRQGKK